MNSKKLPENFNSGQNRRKCGATNFIKQNISSVTRKRVASAAEQKSKVLKQQNSRKQAPTALNVTPRRPLTKENAQKGNSEKLGVKSQSKVFNSRKVVSKTPTSRLHETKILSARPTIGFKSHREVTPKPIAAKPSSFSAMAGRVSTSLRKEVLKCTSVPLPSQVKLASGLQHSMLQKSPDSKFHDEKTPDPMKFKGFKPLKTIATPKSSPACSQQSTPTQGTLWKTLRDEDDVDELSVLIERFVYDAQECLNDGCPPEEVISNLHELSKGLAAVKSHAKYWVALAQAEKAAGKGQWEICDLFREAVAANARPVDVIQNAIKDLATQSFKTPTPSCSTPERLTEIHRDVPTNQKTPVNLAVLRLMGTPVSKSASSSPNVATTNLVSSPTKEVLECESPSSSVKLRVVPRSSPIFKRLQSQRALPDDANAIVTPVRRSKRIASAQQSYPASLQDHEPCLTTMEEIIPSLQQEVSVEGACGVVFDPNLALGDSYNEMAKVLQL